MNERRDELVEQVTEIFASQDDAYKSPFWTDEDQEYYEGLAKHAISLVRAARDAEIREALQAELERVTS